LRPVFGQGRRGLSSALPLEPPIALFGTAGRYANALYSAAAKKGELLDVADDLKLFKSTIAASPVLQNFVIDPSISRGAKMAGISSLMDSAKASPSTKNAMAAMAEGGRMGDVFKVIDLYESLLTAAKGEVAVIITSAKPLGDAEVKKITATLKEKYLDAGASMTTTVKVDEALINGITIEMGDKFLDLSVATQLKKLQALLADGL